MTWSPALSQLRDALATIFPRRNQAEILLDEAGIAKELIEFPESSKGIWHAVVQETEKMSRTADLIRAAQLQYESNPLLHAAAEAYWGQSSGLQPTSHRDRGALDMQDRRVDLAIVTAMADELAPVLDLSGGPGTWDEFTIDGFIHHRTKWMVGERSLQVCATTLWKYGSDPTSMAVARLQRLRPRILAMSGICAGWVGKDKIRLGDVLIAEDAFNPREGKQEGDTLYPNTCPYGPPPWLVQQLKSYAKPLGWERAIRAPRQAPLDGDSPQAYVVSFASDAPVLAVETPFTKPAEQIRKVRAYELEVKSFYSGSREIGVPAFAVKGVVDAGRPEKDDRVREYAAEAAACWLYAFVNSTAKLWHVWANDDV